MEENKKKKEMEKKFSDGKTTTTTTTKNSNDEKGKSKKKIDGKEKKSAKVFQFPKEFSSLSSSEDNNNSTSNIPSKLRNNSSLKLNKIQNDDDDKKNICDLKKESSPGKSGSEFYKYVTGCYVCGSQVPANLRIKHEKECIQEWRQQNSFLSPKDRKPEPVRPDFRFTESGDLDCEGTFESIWANHQDSLVPCKKCGRTFFPDQLV
ncbi:conserved hypothetical protein [Pediculus humanus corporis]|uniref:UBZ4-type domain-containing protein n=1 Tax=Pediculus humanus subsp. corporis TaxID=121224 RepID=E0VXV0_PEDHC|nr:uncharacterized protein Phum_PHUM505010 [Pediculus humanus corporis]EEB18206.1 conserved hypothetical protein [Pediculus humanus corporis]